MHGATAALGILLVAGCATAQPAGEPLFHDSHFHLTNYIQQGPPLREFLETSMGSKAGRVAVFGIPLQQTWSHENSGDFTPTYYLHTDAPLQVTYLRVYRAYDPLWAALDPRASELVRKGNYERLFDEARRRVRAWEKAHLR